MATKNYLAVDLGAESGRVILGRFDGGQLTLEKVHRFPNHTVRVPAAVPGREEPPLKWDILHLWREIQTGIAQAATDTELSGIGIDTWAVDYGLLDGQRQLLGNPYCYRDSRTEGMMAEAFRRLPQARIYELTGIQFLPLNTLYQLLAEVVQESPQLSLARTFLTIPDLINFWLSGEQVCEFTNATTTQCYNPREEAWSGELLSAMNIPAQLFGPVVPPGTVLGKLRPTLAASLGTNATIIAPATHDTGSAVVAVPAEGQDFAWLSSGTWSVVGVNVRQPVITEQSLAYNFTNEGGVGGRFRFSRNVMGLWLVQQCRRAWADGGDAHSYSELTEMAEQAPALQALIDPDDGRFFAPGDMPARIHAYCQETAQEQPSTKGAIVRTILESLALKYRWVLERLEEITGRNITQINIVGGGTQNRLLSQFTADACNRPVITGPIEATATGNLLMQALADGNLGSAREAADVVRNSFPIERFEPGDPSPWDDAYARMQGLLNGN